VAIRLGLDANSQAERGAQIFKGAKAEISCGAKRDSEASGDFGTAETIAIEQLDNRAPAWLEACDRAIEADALLGGDRRALRRLLTVVGKIEIERRMFVLAKATTVPAAHEVKHGTADPLFGVGRERDAAGRIEATGGGEQTKDSLGLKVASVDRVGEAPLEVGRYDVDQMEMLRRDGVRAGALGRIFHKNRLENASPH
jgi:hypothetical protein